MHHFYALLVKLVTCERFILNIHQNTTDYYYIVDVLVSVGDLRLM